MSVTPTQALPRGRAGARDTTALVRPPPRYVTPRAGFEPAFFQVRSSRNLHHQRFRGNSRARIGLAAVVSTDASAFFTTQTKLQNEYCRGALEYGAPPSEPFRFALPSVDRDRSRRSLRQAPRFWTRAIARASPGIRVSRFHFAERTCFGEQKTLRSGGSGGFVRHELRYRLCEIAPMSRARAIEWPVAIQLFDVVFDTALHCSTHVRRTDTMSMRARLVCACSREVNSR